MRMVWLASLLIGGLSAAATASDGETLLAECSEFVDFTRTGRLPADSAGASYCLGLVNGVMGTNTIYRARDRQPALFCPPDERITNARAAKLVVDYLRSHPRARHQDPVSVVVFAFRAAFPCADGEGS